METPRVVAALRHATTRGGCYLRPCFLNVAVTLLAWVNVTEQTPVPVHAPLQPTKTARAAGVAVRVTTVPLGPVRLHVRPQLIPAGFELTRPRSFVLLITVSVTACRANVAVAF
jgi:hypothetical protein